MTQNVTTSLKGGLYKEIKERGWAFNELLELGFDTRKNLTKSNPITNQQLDKIAELEERTKKWVEKTYELQGRINELEETKKNIKKPKKSVK